MCFFLEMRCESIFAFICKISTQLFQIHLPYILQTFSNVEVIKSKTLQSFGIIFDMNFDDVLMPPFGGEGWMMIPGLKAAAGVSWRKSIFCWIRDPTKTLENRGHLAKTQLHDKSGGFGVWPDFSELFA